MQKKAKASARRSDSLAAIQKAARRVARAEAGLQALVGDGVDAILDQDGHALLLKRTQDALVKSEARNKAILESAIDGIMTIDQEGRIVEFNPAATRIFGRGRTDLTGRPLVEMLVAPPMRDACGQNLAHGLARGAKDVLGKRVEMFVLRADGSELPVELSVTRIAAAGPPLLTAYIRDLSQRREAEKNTLLHLERIRALREIDLAMTATLDLQTVLNVLLEKVSALFPAYAAASVRLVSADRVLEPAACRNMDPERWKAGVINTSGNFFKRMVETKTPMAVARLGMEPGTLHSKFFRRYGFISYLGVPLIARDEVLGVLSIYTTREHSFGTEEVEFLTTIAAQAAIAIRNSQLYEETANANRIKEEFLSVMSHELRTPLNVVMGYAALLRDGVLGAVNAEQEDALEKILQRAADQLAMINNIMQTSMLETRARPVRREQVNVAGLLAEIGSDLRARSQKKGVEFVWECLTGPLVVITDGGKLKQILVNLVNNAFKFTHEGRVAVSAGLAPAGPWEENGGRWMEFKVADTGIGIPKEKLPAIFDKFYQVDASDTRSYGGVGLGLYIVKKLAELLGGDVEVESETGSGSTFTVRLPLGEHLSLPLRGAA